jgi:hypothetical protein
LIGFIVGSSAALVLFVGLGGCVHAGLLVSGDWVVVVGASAGEIAGGGLFPVPLRLLIL